MGWLGVAVPVFVIAVAGYMFAKVVLRQRRLQRAWASGLTAEGVCLRSWTTTSSHNNGSSSTTHHHIYEFTPRGADKPVRFEEADGPGTVVEGDYVTIHYPADDPQRATAVPRGLGPLLSTIATLAFLLVFIGLAVWFAYTWLAFPKLD